MMNKEIFIKHYGNKNIGLFLRDYKKEFLKGDFEIDDITKWCNEILENRIETLKIELSKFSSFVVNNIDAEKIVLEIQDCLNVFFNPTFLNCEKLINIFCLLSSIQIQNENVNLLDYLFIFTSQRKKYGIEQKTIFALITDNQFITCVSFFENNQIPFDTEKRFSGFLAYLYYSNYQALYESLYKALINEMDKVFDLAPLLFINLFNFCKFEDTKKFLNLQNAKVRYKTTFPSFNWNMIVLDLTVQAYPKLSYDVYTTIDEITK